MRVGVFIFCLFLINCSKKQCGELTFDSTTKTTYSNNDLFTGDCKTLYFNGKLKSEQSYKEGKDHGDWIFYFMNGSIQTKGTFKNGLSIGEWKYYQDNGKLWKEKFYSENGKKIGVWKEYGTNGDLINKLTFKN